MLKNILMAIFIATMIITGEFLALFLNWSILSFANNQNNINRSKIRISNNSNIARPKFLDVQNQKGKEVLKVLFLGDIMLDRGVEELMKKNGHDYAFEKIKKFLAEYNLVSANLEGPIVANPRDFGKYALQFAFDSEIRDVLSANNIGLVSLANNHTLNMGQEGLRQTRNFLAQVKINYMGDPLKCQKEYSYIRDKIVFLAFNKTFTYCQDEEIIKTISEIKKEHPKRLIIINIHWGTEYKLMSSKVQQNLAHKIIEAGADLIIGHHPHVVQNIELYKNKPIFYSLGNFIFDQYFSKNVQQGLAVGLEVHEDKLIYNLYPIQSIKSQPSLMTDYKKEEFLSDLAIRSGQELSSKIKSGAIKINL